MNTIDGRARVRRARPDDAEACAEIVVASPDYFTDDVPDRVRRDLAQHDAWIVEDRGEVYGFAIVERRSAHAAEISWAAVSTDRRGRGLGTQLIEAMLDELSEDGVLIVEVKTLDPRADYEPYLRTHKFWLARGFVQIDTIDPFPGWEPDNPCAVLVAALGGTRPVSAARKRSSPGPSSRPRR